MSHWINNSLWNFDTIIFRDLNFHDRKQSVQLFRIWSKSLQKLSPIWKNRGIYELSFYRAYNAISEKRSSRKKKNSEFFQIMLWFMIQQLLNSSFKWSSFDVRFKCDQYDYSHFFKLKRKIISWHNSFKRKRIKLQ